MKVCTAHPRVGRNMVSCSSIQLHMYSKTEIHIYKDNPTMRQATNIGIKVKIAASRNNQLN
jgi:hypothetical protein